MNRALERFKRDGAAPGGQADFERFLGYSP
jgi:hypothetical protein